MTDKDAAQEKVLLTTLPHVTFDGWTRKAMEAGAADAGFERGAVDWLFPGGPVDMIDYFNLWADRRMAETLHGRNLAEMKVRERITLAVRTRIEQNAVHKEAIRRGTAFLALPANAPRAARMLYRTVDEMWRLAGDTSTDHNFYTKRGLLAGVYTATLFYWLNDDSEGSQATWAYLDRRIEDVMRIPQNLGRITDALRRLPDPFRLAAEFKNRGVGRFRRRRAYR